MNVRRLEHVAIALRDNTALKAILEGAFGLPLEHEEEHPGSTLSFYPVGETYLELLQPRADARNASSMVGPWIDDHGEGLYHVCLEVDDIRGALAELKVKGIALLHEEPLHGHGGCLVAFVDPKATAGVLFELLEKPLEADADDRPAVATPTAEPSRDYVNAVNARAARRGRE
jgi:methylmalonyl-CoA/ethylmalonyl-CoA epimerase